MLTVQGDEQMLDQVFAALGNGRRRQMIRTLSLHPASIAQLADEQGMSLPAIHRHVTALEEARLIQRRKAGRVNYLALSRVGLRAAQQWLGDFNAFWGSDSETLDNYVTSLQKGTAE